MQKIAADVLFFDFDGTLGETEPEIRQAWLDAIAELDLSCPHFDTVFRVGPSLQETSKLLFPDEPPEMQEVIRAAYRRHYDDSELALTRPYPWCEKLLSELQQRGKKLYIVTNKRKKPAGKLIKNFGFGKYFSGIFTPDVCPGNHVLTKNQLLELAVTVSGVSPSRGVMIGDTALDIAAGRNAETHTCGVTWGYGTLESLQNAGAELIVKDNDFLSTFDRVFR